MIQKIVFIWQEQEYTVDFAAYVQDKRILLPDATLLQTESGWQEMWPPTPNGLVVLSYDRQNEPLEGTAERLNACIAREINNS